MSTATLTAERKPVTSSAARSQEAPVPPAPPAGRDTRGRFVPGNPGGPGNPFARQVAQLRRDILANLTSRDIAQIIATLKMKAISGDMTAIKLLFQYAVGKPANPVNPDTLDIDEFQQLYAPRKEIMKQMNEATKTFEPEFCSGMVRLLAGMLHAKVMDFANMSHQERQRFLENPGVFGGAPAAPPPSPRNAEEDARINKRIDDILAGRCDDIDDNDGQDSDDLPEEEAPPSANRGNGNAAPSTNGGNGDAAPSTKGKDGRNAPSTNGGNGNVSPSTRGNDGRNAPSTNGGDGNARPSTKGGNGHATPSPKPRKGKQQGKNRITLPMRRGSRF